MKSGDLSETNHTFWSTAWLAPLTWLMTMPTMADSAVAATTMAKLEATKSRRKVSAVKVDFQIFRQLPWWKHLDEFKMFKWVSINAWSTFSGPSLKTTDLHWLSMSLTSKASMDNSRGMEVANLPALLLVTLKWASWSANRTTSILDQMSLSESQPKTQLASDLQQTKLTVESE